MSTSIKITANTSEVKKSLLDLSRDVKGLGKTKVSVFSEADRKFIKSELNKEIGLMKTKLSENRAEISKMVKEQTKLEKGSKAELDVRKKIIDSYRTQTRLAGQLDRLQKQQKDMGGFGGMGGSTGGAGGIMGLLGKLGTLAGGLALGGLAFGAMKTWQSGAQFAAGAKNRVRLGGMGLPTEGFGSPEELARVGLTEQDFIRRQVETTARLGKAGGSRESIMQQAGFERAFGLGSGSMMNVSGSLRASFGGKGADQAQMKLQASILASGIEDAIAPYLEATTELLADINSNGMTNTDEMIRAMATMTKEGGRTPEQLADMFKGIDSAVKGASGEANAFLQTAFARAGLGGGTIGATRLAISSGGVFGLNPEELAKRGYSQEQISSMGQMGFTAGAGRRSGAILNQFKQSMGLGQGQNVGDVTGSSMVSAAMLGNSVFQTQGMGGFEAIKLLEKLQAGGISQEDFEKQIKAIKEGADPQLQRLDKVNSTLAGQLTVQEAILENVMEGLGTKGGAKTRMIANEAEIQGVRGTTNVVNAVDQTGALDKTRSGIKGVGDATVGGGIDSWLYDKIHGSPEEENARLFKEAEARFQKKGNMPMQPKSDEAAATTQNQDAMAKAVETGMTRAMQANQRSPVINNSIKNTIKIQSPDGRITEKTHK